MAKKTEMIGFKTTPEIKAALLEMAKREDRSISYIINRILQRQFNLSSAAEEDEKE